MAGHAAAVRWPVPLRAPLWTAFGRVFGVNFEEIRDPLSSFPSFQDFFVRRLVANARPLDDSSRSVVAPCDGSWGQSGRVEDGRLLQVKGRPYSLAALLGSRAEADGFEGGEFATLYLSPKDYHRFHVPCDALLDRIRYLPGSLWPVNRAGVELVDGLFAENERICAFFELPTGGRIGLVAVGATVVGKIRLTFDVVESNLPKARCEVKDYAPPLAFEKGAEWGRFLFGSTLVLIASPGALHLEKQPAGTPLRLGRAIGSLGSGVPDDDS
ncbi:MAG: archaetidylserine decarboxylase [Acidobacteriota bacterium]